jgi:hypothetical protein
MANYVKATNFTAKDSLPTGNSGKIIKGAEIDTEFTAIASAISSKTDSNSPTFTGIPTAPTATAGTDSTQLATTAFVTTAVTNERTASATLTNKTLTSPTINGGAITGITDITVADGGTGASSITANSVILGNGSSALNGNLVAPSTNGNVLTSNGTTWVSSAPAATGVTSLNGQTGAITNTGFNSIGSYTAGVGVNGTTYNVGDTIAGSSIRQNTSDQQSAFTNVQTNAGSNSNQGQTGTWRAMTKGVSYSGGEGEFYLGSILWVRVS